MAETITTSKKKFVYTAEELALLRDPEFMEALREHEAAKKKGLKTIPLKI